MRSSSSRVMVDDKRDKLLIRDLKDTASYLKVHVFKDIDPLK